MNYNDPYLNNMNITGMRQWGALTNPQQTSTLTNLGFRDPSFNTGAPAGMGRPAPSVNPRDWGQQNRGLTPYKSPIIDTNTYSNVGNNMAPESLSMGNNFYRNAGNNLAPEGMGGVLDRAQYAQQAALADNAYTGGTGFWGGVGEGISNGWDSFKEAWGDKVVDGKQTPGIGSSVAGLANIGLNAWGMVTKVGLMEDQVDVEKEAMAYNKMVGERNHAEQEEYRKNVGAAIAGRTS